MDSIEMATLSITSVKVVAYFVIQILKNILKYRFINNLNILKLICLDL